MRTRTKIISSALVVGVLGGLVALGISGAFSATTQNAGNEIRTGTVTLADNDAGQAMFNVDGAAPGDSYTRCIKVTYNGSLPAEVRTYLNSTPGALTPYLNLDLWSGSQSAGTFPGCDTFVEGEEVYSGPISSAIFGDWDSGLVVNPIGETEWSQGDVVAFRVTLSLSSSMPDNVQNATTGPATVIWEARNND
jgi:hypothetical protein